MAINTPKPISRDERYLSKIGGNEEVIVPKPISREEKYMYRAAGYNDQPIPDYPISRKEKYWAKIIENGGGSGNGSTVAFDSGQKFISDNSSLKDYKIYGNGEEIHPTGVLPLTFTAKGGNVSDWVIYGNDENGTENLFGDYETFPSTHIANVNAWTSYDGGGLCQRVKCEGNTEYTLSFANTSSLFRISASSTNDVPTANNPVIVQRLVNTTNSNSETFTTPNNAKFIIVQISFDEQELLNSAMLVKGSTAPDHYIPYQQGVGERTANKMPASANGIYSANRTTVTVTDGVYHIVQAEGSGSSSVYIDLPEFEVPDSGYINYLNSAAYGNVTVVLRYNGESLSGGYALTPINRAVAIGSDYAGKKVNQIQIYTTGNVAIDFTIAPMITDSNTYTAYIPYGYQIPLKVSQQGQTDKSYNIYIGDSPLTEGETVSKTSTGVDIELFEGENTVSTTLYNKPAMEIETSYGVGVKDNNHYIIPFKVNTTIYNIQIGDSPLYDGEYLSYKEKKLYKYINSVLTPIDPPSPFPEISTTEGVNKVIIETSTQPDSIFITTQNPIKLVQPNIGTKTITQNGVYNASDDNLDGYSSVTVNTN